MTDLEKIIDEILPQTQIPPGYLSRAYLKEFLEAIIQRGQFKLAVNVDDAIQALREYQNKQPVKTDCALCGLELPCVHKTHNDDPRNTVDQIEDRYYGAPIYPFGKGEEIQSPAKIVGYNPSTKTATVNQTGAEWLPCPFCGGLPEKVETEEGGFCISCTKCMASSAVEFNYAETVEERWNKRASLTAPNPQAVSDDDYQKYLHLKDDYEILQTYNRNITQELDEVKRELCKAKLEIAKTHKQPVSDALEALEKLYKEAARMGEYHGSGLIKDCYRKIKQALAQAGVQDGYVLVPKEPTDIMFHAAYECINEGLETGEIVSATDIYIAMLAAAPTAKEGG